MALQTSGQIAMGDIVAELDIGGPGQYTLNDANFRALAEVSSGEIELADFYGKSAETFYDWVIQPDYYVVSGQYVTTYSSGYEINPTLSGQGGTVDDATWVDGASITFGGRTSTSTNLSLIACRWFGVNSTNATNFWMQFKRTGTTGSTSFSNANDWTSVEYYADQSDDSGSPTYTFYRTDANFGNSNYTNYSEGYWMWNMANLGVTHPLSAYMGNSGTPSTNGDQYFKIIGIS